MDEPPEKRLTFGVSGFSLSFGERFQHIQAMVGGQNRAAEICGVDRTTIRAWSKSEGKVPLSAALKLAEAAGVTLDWVAIGWDRRPDLPPNDIPPEQALDIARILPIADQAEEAFFMSRTALAPIGAPTEALRFLRAPGDSMAPTI